MPHDITANGTHGDDDDDDERQTPVEHLAVIGKRVWEARAAARAAMQAALNTHAEVVKLRGEVTLYPRVLVVIGIVALLLLGAVLAKVW